MPLFDFSCPKCAASFEHLGKSTDSPACPECGTASERRYGSPPAVMHFSVNKKKAIDLGKRLAGGPMKVPGLRPVGGKS